VVLRREDWSYNGGMSDEAAWQKWFEAIWADREDRVYRDYFGDLGPGIYTLTPKTFEQLGQQNVDPRWLHHGVFECPPLPPSSHVRRDHWVYVSSGMSNPWGDTPESAKPEGFSGLGFEFTLHTREPGRWALELMQWLMAVQLLVAAGELQGAGGGGLVEYHDRVKFRQGKDAGEVSRLLVLPPGEELYPAQFQLASGKVDVMMLVGISEREAEFARTQDTEGLVKLLKHHGVWPLTMPGRASVL